MRSILVIGGDGALRKAIKAAMPRSISAQFIKHPASGGLPEGPGLSIKPLVVFVDLENGLPDASWITSLAQNGSPVVAIISNLRDRKVLYRSGISDCLVRPLVVEEIKARLGLYLRRTGIEHPQSRKSRQIPDHQGVERLERQIIQNERWITTGRLIAGVCHKLTNRIQATQGALSLATEDPTLSEDTHTYLSICQEEARRMGSQLERLRSIYHPEIDSLRMIDISELLGEARDLISDAAMRREIAVEMGLAAALPKIRGKAGQLQFVLLGTLLNLIDLIRPDSGARLWIQVRTIGPTLQIEFSTDGRLALISEQDDRLEREPPPHVLEYALGLPTFKPTIHAHNGNLGLTLNDPGLNVWFSLPIA